MIRATRAGALVLLSALLAVGTVACASTPLPTRAALAGRWQHRASRLDLRVDGSCTARLIDAGSGVVSGTCTWEVIDDQPPQVRLDFSGGSSAHLVATRYLVDGKGGSLILYQNIGGDSADRWELTRSR